MNAPPRPASGAGRQPPAVTPSSAESRLNRATVSMAAGTLASRVIGFARLAALAYALGVRNPLADGYNLANTTPNIVHDLVVGGVLAATAVPVFVARLATRREEEAWDDISAVVSLAVVAMVAATLVVVVAAPVIIGLYTAGSATPDLAQQRAAATLLLRLFVPQVAFYGLISLVTALLNARRRFASPMFAPVANNLVVIAVLLAVHAAFPRPNLVATAHDPALLLLLGLGTTAGVVVQALVLLPSLARAIPRLAPARAQDAGLSATSRADVSRPAPGDVWDRLRELSPEGRWALRWRWQPANGAVRDILGLSSWTLGFVVANQVALFVVLHLAFRNGPGGVSAYTYAYIFFQLPFGIVAVSIMSAVQPELAQRWTLGDHAGFGRRASAGLRAVVVAVIPPAVGYLVLAGPITAVVLAHGAGSQAGAAQAGVALAGLAIGLPGFCAYLFLTSAFQAMQDTRSVFYLYLVENGLNVILAVILAPALGIRGLALSLSIAYTAAAVIAGVSLRRRVAAAAGRGPAQPMASVSDTGQLYLELPPPSRSGFSSLAAARGLRGSPVGEEHAGLSLGRALVRVGVLSLLMAAAVVLVEHRVGADHGLGLVLRLVASVAAGMAVFVAGTALASLGRKSGREAGPGRSRARGG